VCRTSESTDAVGTVGYGYIEAHGTRWPVRLVDWPEAKEKAAMDTDTLAGDLEPCGRDSPRPEKTFPVCDFIS